jgi:hypothetical protein
VSHSNHHPFGTGSTTLALFYHWTPAIPPGPSWPQCVPRGIIQRGISFTAWRRERFQWKFPSNFGNSLSKLCLITGEYISYYLVQQSFTQYVNVLNVFENGGWAPTPTAPPMLSTTSGGWTMLNGSWMFHLERFQEVSNLESVRPMIYPTFQWRSHDVVTRRSLSVSLPFFSHFFHHVCWLSPHRFHIASFLIRWTKSSYCTSSWSQKAWSENPAELRRVKFLKESQNYTNSYHINQVVELHLSTDYDSNIMAE